MYSAIANQTLEQVEQGNPTSLLVENSVSGGEIKAVHEDSFSAASVPNPEKWSHEAIVARSNMRPECMQKLKVAANSGENPGFEYLLSCWQDDPALQIVIKKLLVKFPQWGIAIVDGVLVDWEE
ncbi:Methyl-accepting chemotaxis protein [Nostoc flagelliforme CCNUN1]|uniref:Methyl-accepting chemotaxis protein n=1 Tax=Nostoc flagelliforme CCNUN1 TaxID=2038116 RepID=A0A2K8SJ26_9NOSO|nr:Methyl-accepting chemotaxis protein [Nostoc flagelliforme CCNUN1]